MRKAVLTTQWTIAAMLVFASQSCAAWGWQEWPGNAGGVQAEGRYAVVFSIEDARPNPKLTPGAIDSRVTQANLGETICKRGGYTRSVRPPEQYTERLKREQIRQYGYTDYRLRDYEEDHP